MVDIEAYRKTWFAPATLDKSKLCDLSAKRLINPIYIRRWLIFIFLSIALYVSIYITASKLNWEHDENKKLTDHYYQSIFLVILGTFLFTLGNYNNTFSFLFPIGMIVGGFGIAYLGTLPGFNFSTNSLTKLSGVPLVTVIAISMILLFFAFQTYDRYRKCNMTPMFYTLFFLPVLVLFTGIIIASVENTNVHLHHWQWALAFTLFARFPGKPLQSFLTGLFVGIVIDGISRYGPDPMFN